MATIRCISEQLWVITCNKHCCEAFIRIEWVLFRIAMYWSSGYDPIFCPAISAELPCLKSAASRAQASMSRMRADPGCYNPMFCHAGLTSAEPNWSACFGLLSLHITHACPNARITEVNMVPLRFRKNIELLTWFNRLQLSMYEHNRFTVREVPAMHHSLKMA